MESRRRLTLRFTCKGEREGVKCVWKNKNKPQDPNSLFTTGQTIKTNAVKKKKAEQNLNGTPSQSVGKQTHQV